MKRFLSYSLERNRPVRVLLAGQALRYVNLRVLAMDESGFTALKAGRKTPLTFRYDDILAVTYARGDDGDTVRDMFPQTPLAQQTETKQGGS